MSQKKKNPVATVCSLLGTILLIVLILGCIPLTVPKAFGYNIYTVISGSMEPAIPVGSLVYVKYQEPETIQKKDVIAFYGAKDASSIVTHRVVTNKKLSGENHSSVLPESCCLQESAGSPSASPFSLHPPHPSIRPQSTQASESESSGYNIDTNRHVFQTNQR